jgi:fructokinase
VSVEVASDGQPQFTIHENVAWDRIAGDENARRAVAEANAVCFGTLAQRSEASRASIRRLLALAPAAALRILDVNLRQHFYSREIIEQSLAHTNVLKMNDAELPLLAEMFDITGDSRAQLSEFASRYRLRAVALTRGGNGSLLLADGRWSDHPGVRAKVVDTVGAGDSFTAAMTLGLLAGRELDEINSRANQVAAYVASCAGGTPELTTELRSLFTERDTTRIAK